MTYWGQPANRDSEGRIAQRWKVRKWRRRDGTPTVLPIWEIFEPDGTSSGTCSSWAEAMEWATSIGTRIEYWLENQR